MSDKALSLKNQPDCYAQAAADFFEKGYNCAQAVLLAFASDLSLPPDIAVKISSSFGGGMGRLREVCGAVSGMFMVIGLWFASENPNDHNAKSQHYTRIQELAAAFCKENSSIICRDLLSLSQNGPSSPVPEIRTAEYYKKRPCKELVAVSARLTAQYILNNQ